jgi:hypothetical protein|tara:strand:+ start:439 stop:738 length:300 start_codon:yes stop_codon:yes gene_type:complete
MARYFNITSELTQQLLAAGEGVTVSKISFTNITELYPVKLDLYIEKNLFGKFYILKDHIFDGSFTHENIKFSNASSEFGLFIKLTKIGSTTPSVDVIIN